MIPSAHVSVWGRARRRRVGDRFEYERERGAEFQRGAHLTCEGGRGGGAGNGSAWGCKGGKGGRGQGRKGVAGQPWEGEEGAATSRGGGGDGGRLVRATHHQHELGEARQPTGYHRLAWRRARQACQSTLRWYVRPRTPRATSSAPGSSRATASARGFSSLPRQSPPAPPCTPPPPRGAPPPALLEQLLHVLAGRMTSRRRLAPPNPTGRGAVALTIGWGGAESGASSPTPTVSSRGAGGCRSRGGGGTERWRDNRGGTGRWGDKREGGRERARTASVHARCRVEAAAVPPVASVPYRPRRRRRGFVQEGGGCPAVGFAATGHVAVAAASPHTALRPCEAGGDARGLAPPLCSQRARALVSPVFFLCLAGPSRTSPSVRTHPQPSMTASRRAAARQRGLLRRVAVATAAAAAAVVPAGVGGQTAAEPRSLYPAALAVTLASGSPVLFKHRRRGSV